MTVENQDPIFGDIEDMDEDGSYKIPFKKNINLTSFLHAGIRNITSFI